MTASDDRAGELPSIGHYPTVGGLELHSLAEPYRYVCDICGQPCESMLVAVSSHYLFCPRCYAHQLRNVPAPRRGA